MAKPIRAVVKPELLVWARESAGLEVEEAARRVPVRTQRFVEWEAGEARPTLKQLRKLGAVYKRPIAVFFLPEPPRGFAPMRDFRRLSESLARERSPELLFEVRRAHSRRELAIEMYEAVEGPAPRFSLRAALSDDSEQLAERIRDTLGVRLDEQKTWTRAAGHEAFNNWRAAFERNGILVFQASRIEVSEMRGFSIGDTPFPAIVVNIRDSLSGRVFTMLHELAHIMLGSTGLCDLREHSHGGSEEDRIEAFCNHVAGAAIVPASSLLDERVVREHQGGSHWHDSELRSLATFYGVSSETILRRLLILRRTTREFYRRKRREFLAQYADMADQRPRGPVPPHVVAIARAGRPFVRLVLSNYRQERITATDVSDYLEIRLKHLGKIEVALSSHS